VLRRQQQHGWSGGARAPTEGSQTSSGEVVRRAATMKAFDGNALDLRSFAAPMERVSFVGANVAIRRFSDRRTTIVDALDMTPSRKWTQSCSRVLCRQVIPVSSEGAQVDPGTARSAHDAAVLSHAGPRQLRRLLNAVMSVAIDLDLPTVLQNIVEAARELAGARYAALGVLDPTRTYLTEFITVGLDDEERARIGELPKGHGILGLLIVDPQPIRLSDLGDHPDSFGFPPGHPPMESFLGVPLYVRGEVFGNLYLTDKEDGDGFSDIDEELVLSLAAAAALAIENVRLHEQAGELSLLADRERIGRELHDSVVQRLFATGLAMQGTMKLVERPEVADRLNGHIDDIDRTIREIRMAIFALHVARSSGPSLRLEVLDLVAQSARALGFEPSLALDGPIDTLVPDHVAGQLLAVLREALSNVARHAGATQVNVTVRADTELLLEVVDDGRGIELGHDGGGDGLRNMVYRAQELGGRASFLAGVDGGTTVQWIVPLTSAIFG
jgi:two-component system, NarL family, sensor histidine kinase DevS